MGKSFRLPKNSDTAGNSVQENWQKGERGTTNQTTILTMYLIVSNTESMQLQNEIDQSAMLEQGLDYLSVRSIENYVM